jgi:hypothetical protein
MPLADWTVPMTLTSPQGTLLLNQYTSVSGSQCYFLLTPQDCKVGPTLGELVTRLERIRATKDNVPQGDGSILHHRFLPGMVMNLAVEFWKTVGGEGEVACDDLLQLMLDELMKHVRALQNAGDNQGRLSWSPAGQADRMLDDIRMLTYPAEEILETSAGLQVQFAVDSQWPYMEDLNQTTTNIVAANTITNGGSAPFYPVFHVNGGGTNFQLVSLTDLDDQGNPKEIDWTGSIGGGHYIEIDTFRNTMFEDGSGADVLGGLDFTTSDFWTLLPGMNDITLSGDFASVDVLWQNAWA